MPELSACYFCGTALDEPLSEYPVVPMTLQPSPEEQKTVVLCSVCRRKLGKVIDAVMESIEDRPIDATVQQDLGDASPDASTNGDDVDADEEESAADEEDADEPADAEWVTAGTEEVDEGPSDDEVPVRADEDGVENSSEADEADERETAVDETGDADEDDPLVETGTPADDGQSAADDTASGDDHASADEPTRADDQAQADERTPADPPTAADGNGEDEDGPHLSALEYTKVMRLLENRDLPVDREEFCVVATNAYEITPKEFDTVIDAAIDRGLIVEENGQFVDVD